jgi:hypothetical protein
MTIFVVTNCDISGLKTCSIGNDHLNRTACICEVTSFWKHLEGDVLLPNVLYFKQLSIFRMAWQDPIERSSTIARQ